ncbi:hypothetical protein GcM3_224028 [Golovinomyces cichoracearum]|uniref:Uncharacterized protein n=1 Tax=Golovinomyces cichoracearum TaxID=62708 RepID=A0A420GPK1_9PEZI|nr:hypothetical protein GcM3_224028 [Golovinomyces cichoracearum]
MVTKTKLFAEYDKYQILNYKPHGYRGIGPTFDYKFDIFLGRCGNTGIPKDTLASTRDRRKSTAECLQILARRLANMQHDLDINLRNYAFILNKVATACENQKAFKNIGERPEVNLPGLLNDLRLAAKFNDRKSKLTSTESYLLIDRRCHQGQRKF